MNIVWISANQFGYELLKVAQGIKAARISHLITLSPKTKTVMYDKVDPPRWKEFGINVHYVKDLGEKAAFLRKIKPDLMIVCGWRQKISPAILQIPKRGVIGFHPTLLPYGRGPAPIINSILSGIKDSGVTMFYVNESLDSGDMIGQSKFRIEPDDYAEDVYQKVIAAGRELVRKHLPKIMNGTAKRIVQDEKKAFVFEKPRLENNRIDPKTESIAAIHRKIRALSKPYKGAYIEKEGQRLIIWKADIAK